MGVVARNFGGQVIFLVWKVLFQVFGRGRCVEGIRLATEWAPGRVVLESDCSRIVQAMGMDDDRSELGFVVEEARSWLSFCSSSR